MSSVKLLIYFGIRVLLILWLLVNYLPAYHGGEQFRLVGDDSRIVSRGFYYADIRVDQTDENRVFAMAIWLYCSIDGGSHFGQVSCGLHSDYHAVWIDPEDPNRIWQASDGGVGVSYDRGDSWEYVGLLPFSQFYQIYADNREPYDGKTVYFAWNVVFRSPDFGLNWEVISPDLTTNYPKKMVSAGGPVFRESTTSEYCCTIISLAESPVQPGVIWVGTDVNRYITDEAQQLNLILERHGIPTVLLPEAIEFDGRR